MTSQLFQKFKSELEKVLCWLLSFANRQEFWNTTKPYLYHRLNKYQVDSQPAAMIVLDVTVEEVKQKGKKSETANSADDLASSNASSEMD